MIRYAVLLTLLVQVFQATTASAHELRPAYLELRQTAADQYSVLWKVPALGDLRLGLYVRLPEICRPMAESVKAMEGGAFLERWNVTCGDGLKGQAITIDGLRATVTDVLARIEYRDGTSEIARLTPQSPVFIVTGTQTRLELAETYFRLGVDHILSGLDHLLFVFALILLIEDRWLLVKTVTAFTIAHSITLAGAALGYFSLPQKPVEATIALSIAFLARELIKVQPGERRLSEQFPWMVAFAFGLLHGFGFAGALKEIGLPQIDVPLALFTFNLGVEAGQLMFVAVVLVGFRALGVLFPAPIAPVRYTVVYLIGIVSVMWLIERLSSFGPWQVNAPF
jgi:hydrogenase/urease accessory protein HupE